MAEVEEAQENSLGKELTDEGKTVCSDVKKTKLEDLKVSELKNELEKRNLDKTGLKSVLVERLKAAMVEKGENPEDFNFTATPSKSTSCTKSDEDAVETGEANEVSEPNDDVNSNDGKQDITLQLSLDEEEAQLNEDNLLESSKVLDVDASKVEGDKADLATKEKPSVNDVTSVVESEKKNEPEKEDVPTVKKSSETDDTTVPKAAKKVPNKGDALKSPTVLAKSVWISGLANDTKPADLKNLFSGQGKVLSVKILKSAKQTPAKCFGLVTMANSKDAVKAIQNLNKTELNGQVITVEKKSEQSNLVKKPDSKATAPSPKKIPVKPSTTSPKKVVKNEKSSVEKKTSEKKVNEEKGKKTAAESSAKKTEKGKEAEKPKDAKEKDRKEVDKRSERRPISRSYPPRHNDRSRHPDSREPYRRPFTNQLGSRFRQRSSYFLQKMKEERILKERMHERQEAERRRIVEIDRHRYIERKQREEAYRLEREKERLRIERELLEREKAEIIKLEREKHRLERERLERERDELRRLAAISVAKRPFSSIDRDPAPLWEERKKPASRYSLGLRMEAASSPQLDFPPRGRQGSSMSSRESPIVGRVIDRHSARFNSPKRLEVSPRPFVDREPRREITIRREERQVFAKPDFRDREGSRRSITTREPERSLPARREVTRNDWKQERRVHERAPPSSGARRMNYY